MPVGALTKDLPARSTVNDYFRRWDWDGTLTMERNKVHHVRTVGRVARSLGVEKALIHELTLGLEPEDGVIWVYGLGDDDGTLAFTDEGMEEVRLILGEYDRARRSEP